MKKNIRAKRLTLFIFGVSVLFVLLILLIFKISNISSTGLKGTGNQSDPYRINSIDDFLYLRDLVNSGQNFQNIWFVQTSDIIIENDAWIPIGLFSNETYFSGIYNGNGYSIHVNRVYERDRPFSLFHNLHGLVMNLGLVISEGNIDSSYSIANGGYGGILNSYIKSIEPDTGNLSIAVNFNGLVEGCFNSDRPIVIGLLPHVNVGFLVAQLRSPSIQNAKENLYNIYNSAGLGSIQNPESVVTLLNENLLHVSQRISSHHLNLWKWDGSVTLSNEKFRIEDLVKFQGEGTQDKPYIIHNYDELVRFRDLVNAGHRFSGIFFEQSCDIDLELKNWIPIGIVQNDNAFFGLYDGGGHSIRNMYCKNDYAGFFGKLGGTVINLNIESGLLKGDYAGSIANSSIGNRAAIINSSNYATVDARERAGGIADNFSKGYIENCINFGVVQGRLIAGICSFNANRIHTCFSSNPLLQDVTFEGNYSHSGSLPSDSDSQMNVIASLNKNLRRINNENRYLVTDLYIWQASDSSVPVLGEEKYKKDSHSFLQIFSILTHPNTLLIFLIFGIMTLFYQAMKKVFSFFPRLVMTVQEREMDNNVVINKSSIVVFSLSICSLPLIIFAFGWLKPWVAILVSLCLLICVYATFKNQDYHGKPTISMHIGTLAFVVIAMLLVAWTSGAGGFYYQSSDYHWRNAVFNDLVRYSWPVRYPTNQKQLVYYFFFWLPPALVGKMFGIIVGRIALLVWTASILIGIFFLLQSVLNFSSFRQAIVALLILLFFSGLDIIGVQLATITRGNAYPFIPLHLEWWAWDREFSSNLTQIMWVFNQSLIPWMLILLFLMQSNMRSYLCIGLLMLPHGPLPFLGFFWFPLVDGITKFINRVKVGGWKNPFITTCRELFTVQNILIIPIAYLLLKFLSSNDAVNSGGFMFIDILLDKGFLFYLFTFLVLEALVYIIPLHFVIRPVYSSLFKTASALLLIIPFFQIGSSGDFAMKASIPALFVIMFLCMDFFLHIEWQNRKERIIGVVLIVVLSLGSLTPIIEQTRALQAMYSEKRVAVISDGLGTLEGLKDAENFTSKSRNSFIDFFFKK